jgi:uncharacterized protein (DUF302 family)
MNNKAANQGRRGGRGAFLAGLLLGAVLAGVLVLKTMPSAMIVTAPGSLGFDETVAALEKATTDQGWVVSAVMDMNESLAAKGVVFGPRVKLIKVCKPEYAADILKTDRDISVMMPCTLAVWEDDQGSVMVSRMNTGLMGRLFGGNVARVMSRRAAPDEHRIFSSVLTQKTQ